ncbi:MAG: putative toxin-antitoxin system toxin component, PIN family [Flagellimonas sp.]
MPWSASSGEGGSVYAAYPFLITRLSEMAETYEPKTKLDMIADESDNRLLELAQISKADFIITGNTNDFSMDSFEGTKIMTPKEYWEEYK